MIPNRYLIWLVGGALCLAVIACASPAASPPSPAAPSVTPLPAATATPVPASSTATPTTQLTAPQAAPTLPPPTATSVPVAVEEVEECRQACHEIDINAFFGSGAKHLPASHKGYTVCLECHAPLAKPALPATHAGRQDAACPLCHLPK